MLARPHEKSTVGQFLDLYQHVEGKHELVDGVVYVMSGGSARHADVAGAIYAARRIALRGTRRRVELHERRGPAERLHRLLPPRSALTLSDPAIVLSNEDLFGD